MIEGDDFFRESAEPDWTLDVVWYGGCRLWMSRVNGAGGC